MFAVLHVVDSTSTPGVRVLRITHDEDIAVEHAYQCALDTFAVSDNIDVVDASDLVIDLPDFRSGFRAYGSHAGESDRIVFAVVGVVRKRKSSDTGSITLF